MRSLFFPLCLALAVVPLVSPSALEAVAQSPVGAAGAQHVANDAKIQSVKIQTSAIASTVQTLQTEIKNITDCAHSGLVWDGSQCVAMNGTPGKDATVPPCTDGQFVTVKNGAFACAGATANRKTYTKVSDGNMTWNAINGNTSQTLAIPAGATHFAANIYCASLGKNGGVSMDFNFIPGDGMPTDRACLNIGANDAESTGFGYTKLMPIPNGTTSLKISYAGWGIVLPGTANSVANFSYTFLKEEAVAE